MSVPASASFPALGTTATVAVTDPLVLRTARDLLARQLDELDRACSRFREDSELRMLERAGGERVHVTALLFDALATALRAARLTDGLVTPTLGRSLVLAGYDRDLAAIRERDDAAAFAAAPDWRTLELDARTRSVRIPPGTALDLGATAKALAADRAATTILEVTGSGVLISLGGDISVGGRAPAGGWRVLVDDDHNAPSPGTARMRLATGALATSSIAVRRWKRGGRQLHHILDPRSGRPAGDTWRTVSVAAANCVDANTASTAAIVLGPEAPLWLHARGLPARLVASDGQVVTVGGWPARRVEAAA